MEITVGIVRAIVVDYNVYTLHIDTTTENVGSDKNTLLECLEGGVTRDTLRNHVEKFELDILHRKSDSPLLLGEARVNGDGREVARNKELVQLNCTRNGLDKDNDLNRRELESRYANTVHLPG